MEINRFPQQIVSGGASNLSEGRSAAMQNGFAGVQCAWSAMQNGFAGVQRAWSAMQNGFAVMQRAWSAMQNGFAAV
jgi:hypothetical protein